MKEILYCLSVPQSILSMSELVKTGLGCVTAEKITDGNRLDMCLKHITSVGLAEIHKSW